MTPCESHPPSPSPGPANVNLNADIPDGFILFSNELPSGDVQDVIRRLHRYAMLPRYPHLARFLQNCALVLRTEVQKLPRSLRDSVPPFHDVVTLASHWDDFKSGSLSGAWDGAFLCIYEIAMLIGHHETHDLSYRRPKCLVGISVGLFSAAAVAVAESLADLVSYGAESLRTAFAFCVHVQRVSWTLETTATEQATSISWATVVTGLPADTIQGELVNFNGLTDSGGSATTARPLTGVSISHVDKNSVGVTGPPSRLKQLFRQSEVLRSSRHSPLPISGGLCHAPNVYDSDDVRAIIATAEVWWRWGTRALQVPLISPFTGSPYVCSDAYRLIEAICTEALTKPLCFDKVAQGVVTQLNGPPSCQILHYGASPMSDTIIAAITNKLSASGAKRQCLGDWAVGDAFDQLQDSPSPPQTAKLAVVGMSCRMPGGADTPERFWELLVNGIDTHTTVPPDRFDLDAHYDGSGEKENTVGTRFGNFIDNPGNFDAGFFNMSPREAEQTDPMQRLALVTAYEALEMAGFVPNRTPSSHVSRVGTYYGQASDDYREVNASQKIGTYGIPGTERGFGNGRVNYFFDFQGPSFNLDTACSSGLAAVQAACSALWAGEADTVVAGGLNIITNPDIYCMLSKGHFLSKTGQCKVWDIDADGYCRADGVGSVVIKRLDDALADNDVILASIIAGATNHSAESISITQPHAAAQMENYRQVMNKAGVNPLDVSFVELHGTGTQVGDAVESESVLDFFAPQGRRLHPDKRLHLGGVKSNIGHGEAAAGIASLVKVLLMYRHNMIPRHIGIKTTMNPVVAQNLANRNAGIASENRPWLRTTAFKKRYSVVNSFGAHGGNTTLLLEDAPVQPIDPDKKHSRQPAASSEVVCISAKSKASLRANVRALLGYLDTRQETELRDIAYTTSARRIHHHIRIATAVSSTAQLRRFLQAAADDVDAHARHVATGTKKTVVFAFSGQGCLYHGAAARLFERAPLFRDQVVQLDRIVRRLGFPAVLDTVAGDNSRLASAGHPQRESSPSIQASHDSGTSAATIPTPPTVESPLVTQLALVVIEIALAQYWELLGIKPSVVIGHSLGEYAALVSAGVLSVADALFLVGKRASLMLAACEPGSHAMLSVRGASVDRIEELCRARESECCYEVACVNGLTDVVVTGLRDDMASLRDMLHGAGLKCVLLDMPFAFHSRQMSPILEDFENAAQHVTFKIPQIPVISPLLGECVLGKDVIDGRYLARATREPVDFVTALDAARSEGVVDDKTAWIDIGPHPVCTSFTSNHYGQEATQTFASHRRGDETLSTFTASLAALHCLGLPVAWNEYYDLRESPARLLHLDSYQWNCKNYWIPYDGSWTLDKAHAGQTRRNNSPAVVNHFHTSSVQQIISEEYSECIGQIKALSDLHHPDMRGAADGHQLNGRSVVTGSIWADIALTVGEYLYKKMVPDGKELHMDVKDMKVFEAQVLHPGASRASTPEQFIQIEGVCDLSRNQTAIRLYAANKDGTRNTDKAFATATVCYEEVQDWQEHWHMASHLVAARANSLWEMAAGGTNSVSHFSQSIAYQIFANVVDYGARYRGMQRVALCEDTLEATADIVLDNDRHGTWHTPPHWIDSAFQLAGFVMNAFGVQGDGNTAGSARDFFYITPGWRHLRLLERLEPGPDATYRSFVRMLPTSGEPGAYVGDIYLHRGQTLVGICAGIKFKAVPRALLPVMFPRIQANRKRSQPAENLSAKGKGSSEYCRTEPPAPPAADFPKPERLTASVVELATLQSQSQVRGIDISQKTQSSAPVAAATQQPRHVERRQDAIQSHSPQAAACLALISDETGLDLEDLTGQAAFADLGVDSLMSLALSAKIRAELGIDVQASIFLEYPTVQELVTWLSR
ncbi:type I polyketide synthase [Aspergillus mulundensis]|uniref:Beta-ketoacyl synthase N-terminal protein n=1 Tax=Aspergillus mulundensis TaxID=1810919 RepID=A0A3D8QA96_9EURO|nr:Beta-ketoacyl synthase N-terminal protein [Aspergillus mulundensis]RDW58538.1 Beta-ketoacyl synthase N-terminal protein [Aspergillus mulundensis]